MSSENGGIISEEELHEIKRTIVYEESKKAREEAESEIKEAMGEAFEPIKENLNVIKRAKQEEQLQKNLETAETFASLSKVPLIKESKASFEKRRDADYEVLLNAGWIPESFRPRPRAR